MTEVERFVEMAKAAGAEVHSFERIEDALSFAAGFSAGDGGRSALVSPDLASRPGFADALAVVPARPGPAGGFWLDRGFVAADFGIAETGTLVHFDHSDAEKDPWTLPDACVCFLERARIVPAAEAIADRIERHLGRVDLGSPQVSFVTGPSRTADIESRLAIGVHGPTRLVILIHP
jgi:L-lactate dehydrogenase complex protein LldG